MARHPSATNRRRGAAAVRDEAWQLLRDAAAMATEHVGAELDQHRALPLGWFDVLARLHAAPRQQLRMTDLADAVLLSTSGLTRVVAAMERARLVRRRMARDDRRVIDVLLTDKGRTVLRQATPTYARAVARHFGDHVTGAEARMVIRALRKVRFAASVERARQFAERTRSV
jgi:DNA-binding MarR family transcriptional regulator